MLPHILKYNYIIIIIEPVSILKFIVSDECGKFMQELLSSINNIDLTPELSNIFKFYENIILVFLL